MMIDAPGVQPIAPGRVFYPEQPLLGAGGEPMAVQAKGNDSFFKRLRGNRNASSILLFEPMFGIPYNLFIPYFSLYMVALGCTPEQIGLINTVGMVCQMLFSVIAPPITDRLGRNRTTVIFDILSWSVALALWYFADGFWFFLVAAVIQSTNRIVHVSWTCLLVEDTDKDLLVRIFSWLTIAGLASAVFSPAAAGFVKSLTVVPAVRWLLALSFVLMTAMFLLRNSFTRETAMGRRRQAESRREPFFAGLAAVFLSVRHVARNKRTLLFFALTAIYNAALVVKGPFFALLITDALHFSEESAGYFAAASSGVMLAIYLFAQPVLARLRPRLPLAAGLVFCAAGALVLLLPLQSQAANLVAILVSVTLTAVGTAVAQPFLDGLSHGSIDNENRSNMTSILLASTLLASAPFGWLGGLFYDLNARLPFLAGAALFLLSAVLLLAFYKNERQESRNNEAGGEQTN